MAKTIIVSNRLPLITKKVKDDELEFTPSVGGLATGLSSIFSSGNAVWVGSPGLYPANDEQRKLIEDKLVQQKMSPVFITDDDNDKFYGGMSNATLWPIFHYFVKLATFSEENWNAYVKVNQQFANHILSFLQKEDTLWIQDYHLFLLPRMIKKILPDVSIGFFLHIPFPSYEVFRLLPWREGILKGILGSDLIGFHTYDDVRHFMSAASRLVGTTNNNGMVETEEGIVKVEAFPMGIDYAKFSGMSISNPIKIKIDDIKQKLGHLKLILSVDRLDISKGIPEKLKSYEIFLEKYPQYRGSCCLILIVVPSRVDVKNYQDLKNELEKEVGRINGKFGKLEWMPIYYNYTQLPEDYLTALYKISDIALITPLRDGMNLVAKEYIASQSGKQGVLILSELAGASKELSDAIIVNPYDYNLVAESIKIALEMPLEEQKDRLNNMQIRLQRNDINKWSSAFLAKLTEVKQYQSDGRSTAIKIEDVSQFVEGLKKYKRKVVLLDYDGTLVGINPIPLKAKPDMALLEILQKLSVAKGITLVVVTGRNKQIIGQWLETLDNVHIIAEHGIWLKSVGKDWQKLTNPDAEWKSQFLPIMQNFTDITPGTHIEEKDFTLAWHYRNADPDFGVIRARELVSNLEFMTKNKDLQVMEGKKVIEVKPFSINKGIAVLELLKTLDYDLSIAFGDDVTDEEMFKSLMEKSINIKVGETATAANYRVKSPMEVRQILELLV